MDEGTFGEWLKADGEFVEAGEAIFTLESEKALQEVESVDAGILRILPGVPREGDTVAVGTLLAYLLEEGEALPTGPLVEADSNASVPSTVDVKLQVASDTTGSTSTLPKRDEVKVPRRKANGLPAISPRAARLARELGVDWSGLNGSGRTGRIRECDIRAAASPQPGEERSAPHTRIGATRRIIAERMLSSVRNTAPVTLTTRVDATQLVDLREQYKNSGHQLVPAYHDIIAKLTAITLRQFPVMNCRWTEDGLTEPDGIHMGLAVDTEAGLLVPVIRNVDQLALLDLATKSRNLIERARQRACTANELSGGTFTITNLGQFGIDTFTPIINTPETAILGLGAIRREAVVLADDRIVPRDQLPLSLTFDHRVTDGAPAARFLQELRNAIENPGAWLIQ
jgi:pyruvate dehydrogenase E2 component (dihydrolipoamide acetyltransferase)